MTDAEPEPFRMSTEPDDGDVEHAQPTEDADVEDAGSESIADLIDEASRTAADQSEREAAGAVPADRSADVWGDQEAADGDTAAVWEDAEHDGGAAVWELDDASSEEVWSDNGTDEPELGTSAVTDGIATDGAQDEEEPEPFHFDAGPQTSAPAADSTDEDEDEGDWTVPGTDEADGEHEHDDDVWTFDVQDLQEQDEQPLAETAAPRDDTGWHDQDAEKEPTWSVPDLPVRARDDEEEEPDGFSASLDEAPVDSDLPPPDAVADDVQDALGDLLGSDEQDATGPSETAATAADTGSSDPDLDHLDDLDGLEHLDALDDLSAPTGLAPTAEPAEDDEDDEDDDGDTDDESTPEEPLDAATAARQVMEPGSVTFSSGGKKKKRGLFG